MALTGKAAVFIKAGEPFRIQELPVPQVEPGGILVKLTAASICGSDLHYWRGDGPPLLTGGSSPGPLITGHEMMGRVHTLGQGVTTDSLNRPLQEGDRVVFFYLFPCLRCYNCIRGELASCPHRRRFWLPLEQYPYCSGGYAEYFYLHPGHFVFKVPEELPDEAVAPVNCALSQVTYGLHQGGLRMGDTVVVQGAGGLGVNACAVAKETGAHQVIVIDGQDNRLELARQCGADVTINLNELREPQERVARVRELTEGRGADVVLEVVGFPQAVPEGLDMLRPGGTYVEIGHITPGSGVQVDFSRLVRNSTRILAVLNYNPWVIPVALDFLVRIRDRYPLAKLVSHRFPLERINEAFQEAEWQGKAGGTAVTRAILTP
ncbi:MAG: zinc-binding dehydrogenase [Dehalococcoidia bacterium]